MPRYSADAPLWSRPGTVHYIGDRRVKAVPCQHGYAIFLLGWGDLAVLPVPTGGAQTLADCLTAAAAFFRQLDRDPRWSPARPHGVCANASRCAEHAADPSVQSCKPSE